MALQDFLGSATLFDVVIALVAMALFVVGWFQGAIRQLIGIAAFLLAFLLAANLRDPLGDFLARNWTFWDRGFNLMLALLGLWIAFSVTLQIGIQAFYRRLVISRRLLILDEVLGGLLGAFQVFLVIALLTLTFDSYYLATPRPATFHDVEWARSVDALLRDSAIAGALRDGLATWLLTLLGPLLPTDLRAALS
jgi:uncharacterized membrane protein required for colicin V production